MASKPTRRTSLACLAVWLLFSLSGCLYPDQLRGENQTSEAAYVTVVQSAIDQFYAENSLLPIKNSTVDTPIYEKYIIDFERLLATPFLGEIPPNAFEKGGSHQYVLVNVDEKPLVRLLDLVTAQQVNEVQREIRQFAREHEGALPLGQDVTAGWYSIDYDRMGIESVQVRSVYSGRYLGLLLNRQGKVIVDYGLELAALIKSKALTPPVGKDLRSLLIQHSLYVPVKSASYYWRNGEPAISAG